MTSTSTVGKSELTAEFVNPIISATISVFEMMLSCTPKRTGLSLKQDLIPQHELSAVIGISGKVAGTLVLSLSKSVGIGVLDRLVGISTDEINDEVCDAVCELANMIAGSAKAQLEHLEASISIPNIITGKGHTVHYPSNVSPICIAFDSEIGTFSIEAGFSDR
ncbi:chemotaxis protein CheX [Gimesia sp.]|uniref:chemotaxis protein CheX n=1 Tax=Gimesia sp. TaxID=2024833 RepID=UPI003A91ECB9